VTCGATGRNDAIPQRADAVAAGHCVTGRGSPDVGWWDEAILRGTPSAYVGKWPVAKMRTKQVSGVKPKLGATIAIASDCCSAHRALSQGSAYGNTSVAHRHDVGSGSDSTHDHHSMEEIIR
jgi:hypothetical protein